LWLASVAPLLTVGSHSSFGGVLAIGSLLRFVACGPVRAFIMNSSKNEGVFKRRFYIQKTAFKYIVFLLLAVTAASLRSFVCAYGLTGTLGHLPH